MPPQFTRRTPYDDDNAQHQPRCRSSKPPGARQLQLERRLLWTLRIQPGRYGRASSQRRIKRCKYLLAAPHRGNAQRIRSVALTAETILVLAFCPLVVCAIVSTACMLCSCRLLEVRSRQDPALTGCRARLLDASRGNGGPYEQAVRNQMQAEQHVAALSVQSGHANAAPGTLELDA